MTTGKIQRYDLLVKWRLAKNLSREQVEQALGFPGNTIERMEREGITGLPPTQLHKLASLYEVELDEVLEALIQTQLAFQKGLI
jgi:transcriptional regulator with XRE-family HTH domain